MPFSRTKIAAGVTMLALGGLTGAALSAGGGTNAASARPQTSSPVVTQVVTETTHRVSHVRKRVYRRARQSGAVRAAFAAQPSPPQPQAAAAPPARRGPAVRPKQPAPVAKAPVAAHQSVPSTDDKAYEENQHAQEDHADDHEGVEHQDVEHQDVEHEDGSGSGD